MLTAASTPWGRRTATMDALAWSLAALVLVARVGAAVGAPAREKALAKLHEVFGVPSHDGARLNRRHEVPPQFMTELYSVVAEPSGLTKCSNPYNAVVVRSFMERDNSSEQFFSFNISGLDSEEYVLEAELHLYRMRTPPGEERHSFPSSPDCLLHVYQVVDDEALSQPDVQRLLSVQYISLRGSGWLVVNVKQAVLDWVSGKSPNLGLLVVATSMFNEPVRLHVARRNQHHNSKQPILVLFNGDHQRPSPDYHDGRPPPRHVTSSSEASPSDNELAAVQRNRRSFHVSSDTNESVYAEPPLAANSTNSSTLECSRHPLHVNFTEVGWDSWIVAPNGYDAYQCKGHCDFPMGLSQRPTNHATVLGLVHELKLDAGVSKPCCVPSSLRAVSILYLSDESSVVLRNIEHMVAESCGCH